jgi:putative glutamine amidotransferase
MSDRLPLVGVPADFRGRGVGRHSADESYIQTLVSQVGAIPVILPALEGAVNLAALLERLDGLLLTGSESNVAAARYGAQETIPGSLQDIRRDASNLPIIASAIAKGIPLLAVCRGFQELNVAHGGSLHQKLHELPGRIDHRAPAGQALDVQFAVAHEVDFADGGVLAGLTNCASAKVNSLHWQGIDRLGDGLAVEAMAPDGTIEAVRVTNAPAFALGVQWHPEYRPADDRVSAAIWAAFRDAVARRHRDRGET